MECIDTVFSMRMDVYYAVETQDRFGRMSKDWIFNQTLSGFAEVVGAVDRETLQTGKFFEYTEKLIGRSKVDPRIDSSGQYFPINNIRITDIRDANNETEFFIEAAGERQGLSTLYDILAVEPYVNPWNEIEYYKIMFSRTQTQEALDDSGTS